MMTVRLRVSGSPRSSYSINNRSIFLTPDDQIERLTVVTGADGVATVDYLPAAIDPLNLRVTAPASSRTNSRSHIVRAAIGLP